MKFDTIYDGLIKGTEKLALVGLGYVGMPIAVEFAKHISVIGFDISEALSPEKAELLKPLATLYRSAAYLLVIRDEYDIYVPQNVAGLISNARNQGQIIDNFYK